MKSLRAQFSTWHLILLVTAAACAHRPDRGYRATASAAGELCGGATRDVLASDSARRAAPLLADASDDPAARAFLSTLDNPARLEHPPESLATKRLGFAIESVDGVRARYDASLSKVVLDRLTSSVRRFAGRDYVEFPNSTLLQTVDPRTRNPRSFLFVRGVRPYSTQVDLATGKIDPQGYVSDVLLFEIVEGKAEFRSLILASIPEKKFFFEDPRISTLYDSNGRMRAFLSGTDYSPHVAGSSNPDVVNRYVELALDGRGQPRPVRVGRDGKPQFKDLSPLPRPRASGGFTFTDAKNATIARNEAGEIVVRTRLRPDFEDPAVMALFGARKWKYGEQVFVFEDEAHLNAYDWGFALEDLAGRSGTVDRSRPKKAVISLTDSQLKEQYRDLRVIATKGKGLGPGTPPVRVRRDGKKLFVSDGKNAPERLVTENLEPDFPLRDQGVTYLSFDHEIRYFADTRGDRSFVKRHYSMSIKQWDASLTTIDAYYADALSPLAPQEVGAGSQIADLLHVYPMGREIVVDAEGRAFVRVSLGTSDAHTELVAVDLVTLLREMGPNSPRRQSGQVYAP